MHGLTPARVHDISPLTVVSIRKFFFGRVVASENQGLRNLRQSQFYCNFIAILSRFWRFWQFAAIYSNPQQSAAICSNLQQSAVICTVAYIFTANCCKLLKSPKLPQNCHKIATYTGFTNFNFCLQQRAQKILI